MAKHPILTCVKTNARSGAISAADKQTLQGIISAFSEPALIVGDGICMASNPAFEEFAQQSADDLLGKPMVDLIDHKQRDDFVAHMVGGKWFDSALRRGEGKAFGVVAIGQPITGVEGQFIVRFRSVQGNKNEKLSSAEQVRELQRLQETNQFKTDILNTTAHELNTPLTPVRLQMHLLRSGALGPLPDRQSRALSIINRNVERLAFLVNDILDVARLEGGQLELNRSPSLLAEILRDSLESFDETARRVGVALSLEGPADVVVDVDADRIIQVVYNLVGNALKFTPSGGTVVVRSEIEGEVVKLSVIDSGMGLEPEQISRLFQPFSRVHDTQTSAIAGTGLGLFICRGIVEAHGSQITVTSAGAGAGAAFSFTVPISDQPAEVSRKGPSRPAQRPVDALAKRLRELI